MKKRILLGCILALGMSVAHAQVKIGANPTTIQNSSLLELENEAESGNNQKGLQLPKVALTATNVWAPMVGSPASGMTVYNTNTAITGSTANGAGAYVWYSSRWNPLTDWSLTGNNITAGQVLGTNNAQDLIIRAGGINRISVSAENGQTAFAGGNIGVPRVYIGRPAAGGINPGLYVETSTGFNSALSSNIVIGNAAGNTLQGIYGFVNGGYTEATAGQISAGISFRRGAGGTLSLGVASAPYGAGDATADKLVITGTGDVIVQGTLRTRVTRVGVTNSVVGGATAAPAVLSNLTSSYISLSPAAGAEAYQVPSASQNAGLMLIIKNNAGIAAQLSSAGGSFVSAGSITPAFLLDPTANIRTITIISDGVNWQITAVN